MRSTQVDDSSRVCRTDLGPTRLLNVGVHDVKILWLLSAHTVAVAAWKALSRVRPSTALPRLCNTQLFIGTGVLAAAVCNMGAV